MIMNMLFINISNGYNMDGVNNVYVSPIKIRFISKILKNGQLYPIATKIIR